MFDYISALYFGDDLGMLRPSPLEQPSTEEERELTRQLRQIAAEMGGDFADSFLFRLRAVLNGCRQDTFRDGFRLGGQLMLTMLEETQ